MSRPGVDKGRLIFDKSPLVIDKESDIGDKVNKKSSLELARARS